MIRMVYCTTPSSEVACDIGAKLIEERLAACINVLPGMTSIYRWQGKIERAAEAVLVIKTPEERVDDVLRRVQQLHPYEVPCLLALHVTKGNPAYLDWLEAAVRP